MVSIGPYNRGKPELKVMEELKWQFLGVHLSANPDKSIADYRRMMKQLEARTRRCYSEEIKFGYSEEIKLGSDEFVEMMLLDGCFLVQILLPSKLRVAEPERELAKMKMFNYMLIHDLLMFENQLPFFVVETLLDALQITPGYVNFKVDVLKFLSIILPSELESFPAHLNHQIPYPRHFLHLIYSWYFKNPKPKGEDDTNDKYIPCAMEVVEAGVKLQKIKGTKFFELSFCDGVLMMPTVAIDIWTCSIFRNLLAIEHCCPELGSVVTSYVVFMGAIIDSPGDVSVLERNEIIDNSLGTNKEVSLLFKGIGKNISYSPTEDYLAQVHIDANKYCKSMWPRCRATLVRDYFSSPWSYISFGAAFALFGLTIIQTVFSILSYNPTA